MSKQLLLQEAFLSELCTEKVAVSIFLINGIKLHGVVDTFDEHVIMLKNSITQMIYKHAISTVVPAKMITLSTSDAKKNMAD